MEEIAKDMRAIPTETRNAIRPALRAGGEFVAREAMVNASWSTRIPGSIKVEVSFRSERESVRVVAGGTNAPHARPFEHLGEPGTFRHRVHGRDVWVAQAARPFLFPAGESAEPVATASIRQALDDVGASLGFTGG